MRSESHRTVLVALAANAVIAIAKGIGGAISGSAAMLAEAAHSVADTTNQLFLLVSLSLSEREPDEAHPFGYGQERFFWAFLAAVFIFIAGAMFSIGEGVQRLLSGGEESTKGYIVSYVVLAIAFVSDGTSLIRAMRQTRGEAGAANLPVGRFIRHTRNPTSKTVVFEDTAAVIGVVIAAVGIGLHQATGNRAFDAAASILIGLLLVAVAIALGRDTKGLLLGEAARPEEREALREVLDRHDEVDHVLDLLTMALGPGSLLVAVRLDFADGLDSDRIEAVSTQIEEEMREAVPDVTQVFLDATRREGERAARSG
jgi:cation diffusion facilitator family transporter